MKATNLYLLLFSLLLINQNYFAQQKVGLVLSGGGATGLAHVGVLKALEEHNIPIDYITGTSAGALVGSLYAAGYSPEEIETYILSDDFQLMAYGEIHPHQHFLLNEPEPDAGLVSISLSQDSLLKKSLPTNFTSSSLLDFHMLKLLGPVSASTGDDFNNLFVPFRCVASDIANKKSVVFNNGHLNAAVRASMTYPFYFKSIRIDDVLLFDGGLYNNFPANVMYKDFNPDYIIGSNVSFNADLPNEDDIISQLTNMLVSYTDFGLPCEEGMLIKPNPDVSAFGFKDVKKAIDEGYNSTIEKMDSLKMNIHSRRSKEEVENRRKQFKKQIAPINISSVSTSANKRKLVYSGQSMMKKRKSEVLGEWLLEKRYFRLNSIPQIDFVYPTLDKNTDSTYNLGLELRKSKEIQVKVGGHLSSRPVNTGYVSLSYQSAGKILTNTKLETYFGKFYGSAKAEFTLRIPTVYPFTTKAYFTLNRWDYFRSFATFFEDVKPSFLVQNEIYTGISVSSPFGNTVKNTIDARYFQLDDLYYQTDEFSNKDTADVTTFNGFSASWGVTQNSLNRIQFASGGHLLSFKVRYVYGKEHSASGTTSPSPYDIHKYHSWVNLKLDYQSFVIDKSVFHLGLHGQLVYNSHPLFANYTATLLSMTEFSLIPDAKTYFLPEYRSPQYASAGLNTIFTIKKKIDFRIDAYIYQPFIQVLKNDDGTQELSKLFSGRTYMASSSLIYNSYIGPIRLTLNYFPMQVNPLAFQFSIGYVIFNERAIR